MLAYVDEYPVVHLLAGKTGMVDGLQAGGQLHDDRPDGGLRQQWSIARSLHVTLMTAKII